MGLLGADGVAGALKKGRSARLADVVAPKFRPGAAVRVRNLHPEGHTRLPRYVRGLLGVVERDHGVFVFPDSNAAGTGTRPQHVYSVRFPARRVWGPEAAEADGVYVDLWDDHLDPA